MHSFVGQYLSILDFPRDVRETFERGNVNLYEAHQFARLSAKKLGGTDAEARSGGGRGAAPRACGGNSINLGGKYPKVELCRAAA